VGVYSDLSILSTTAVLSILVTATINDTKNTGVSSASSIYTLKLHDPCTATSISASSISIQIKTFDPVGQLVFGEFNDTVSVSLGGSTPLLWRPKLLALKHQRPIFTYTLKSVKQNFSVLKFQWNRWRELCANVESFSDKLSVHFYSLNSLSSRT
jgi:hypothetical protein